MVQVSRRRLLVAGLVAAAGGLFVSWRAGPSLLSKYRERAYPAVPVGRKDASPFDPAVLEYAALFVGAAYGRQFNEVDNKELLGRLHTLVTQDDAWRPRLSWFSAFLDELAIAANEKSFAELSIDERETVVNGVLAHSIDSRRSKVLAFFSADERVRRLSHRATIPRLQRIYLTSGIPWRARGYSRWPGVPGDAREYTRAGVIRKC